MAGQLHSLGSSYPWKALAYIPSSCNVVVRLSPNNHWLQQWIVKMLMPVFTILLSVQWSQLIDYKEMPKSSNPPDCFPGDFSKVNMMAISLIPLWHRPMQRMMSTIAMSDDTDGGTLQVTTDIWSCPHKFVLSGTFPPYIGFDRPTQVCSFSSLNNNSPVTTNLAR